MKRLSNRAAAPRRVVAAVLLVCLSAILLGPVASAGADAFGQLQRWGSQGTDPGQFFFSTSFGVDTDDDSVFVVDFADTGDWRLQKLSSSGDQLASTVIPASEGGLIGAAVDAARDRVYFVVHRLEAGGAATAIRVFSTVPDGSGRLVAPADLPSGQLPVPTGADALVEPAGIAVDPTTHDLVVAAGAPGTRLVVQRIGEDGVAGSRFADAAGDVPLTAGVTLSGLVVAPQGQVYVSTGNGGRFNLYAVRAGFDGAAQVDTATAAAAERWHDAAVAGPFDPTGTSLGPQLAIDAAGTLYWSESIANDDGASVAGNYIVRGWSPQTGRTQVVYGGGSASCRLERTSPALAAGSDGTLWVLDHAPFVFPAPYGEHVYQFGPGGSGCPIPTLSLTIGGRSEETVTVGKGQQVTFDASGSDLRGATLVEAAWDFDGSGQFAVTGTELRATHRFTRAGRFVVSMRLRLSGSPAGDPEVVRRTVVVTSPAPTASFTVSDRNPEPGATVAFDASGSVDPAGGDDARPTNQLASYSWEFGDGATQVTTTPTVTHAYANGAADPLARTVKLTVTSRDGVASAPVSQTVTVKGTAVVLPPPRDEPRPPVDEPRPPVEQPRPTPTAAKVAIRGVRATSASAVGVTLSCPAGSVACAGTLTLTTKVRVKGRRGRRARTQTLVLGTIRFSLAAGGARALTVRLSARGRSLLAKSKKLKLALAAKTVVGASSATQTASATISLPRRRARRAKK